MDLSKNNIEYASQFQSGNLEFERRDIREDQGDKIFDYVFNLFTSFGYFRSKEDDIKVFTSVHKCLRNNGIFVLDFINVKKAIKHIQLQDDVTIDGTKFQIKRWVEDGFLFKEITVNSNEGEKLFTERVRCLRFIDFQQYAEQSGLKVDNVYGNYELEAFDENESDRLIITFSKIRK